ncbi:chorismate synthase [Sedimentibacter sp. zth1]|uniref:chorismate synthase n=1 Tax=Sedimentibacter sp. zth1 TaxID=2816908 RepID=UPI001A92EAF6|nr:chorismate synthase [Sedimentibacter sp. zth1]QSX06090.1 chorismate synthase [Sedimentibacter sp. zth1]
MSSIWGNKLKISIFGESHGTAIGVTIDGFKSGFEVDFEYINEQMKRRAPGRNILQTSRKEDDEYEILSGVFNGITTGSPICAIIHNKDRKSKDYEKIKNFPRPSHSDYPAYVKYDGFNDYRGGGHFSGRLTAPLVFAGALCKSYLEKKYNILIGSHIKKVYHIEDEKLTLQNINVNMFNKLKCLDFPTINDVASEKMKNEILKAKEENNSVGGDVEVFVLNMPVGIGEPMFDSIESRISHMMFSIPAIKGIEFGDGFDISNSKGFDANDNYCMEKDKIMTKSNHNGGVLGGLSTSMPIIFNTAIKPTPSIAQEQDTVDLLANKDTRLLIEGRHDPCIVQRAVPVIECATAIVLLDLLLNK